MSDIFVLLNEVFSAQKIIAYVEVNSSRSASASKGFDWIFNYIK